MIGTVIALILSAIALMTEVISPELIGSTTVTWILAIVGTVFLPVTVIVNVLLLGPMQRSEASLTPKLIELYKRDFKVRGYTAALLAFPLVSYVLAFAIQSSIAQQYSPAIVAIWITLFGVATDTLRLWLRRCISFLNPSDVVIMIGEQASSDAQGGRIQQMTGWIDALTETALQALDRTSTSLAIKAVDSMNQTMKGYLEVSGQRRLKGFASPEEASEVRDTVSYSLFYLFQRLEMIHDKALDYGYEPVCSAIVATLGKLAVYTGKYDMTMASFALHFLGKLSREAVNEDISDVGVKASFTLQEVAKLITEECNIANAGFKDLYLSINKHLEELAKSTFKRNKNSNIHVLMEPFRDLKLLFNADPIKQHPDAKSVESDIDRVLEEFVALTQVMTRMGPGQAPKTAEPGEPTPEK